MEVLDELKQVFDQAVPGMEGRARRKLDELLVARAKGLRVCIEVSSLLGWAAVLDSKHRVGGMIVPGTAWATFLTWMTATRPDLPAA